MAKGRLGSEDGAVTGPAGGRVAYRVFGRGGRPLVLLHGGGANLVSMEQYVDALGGDRLAVAVDLPGSGASEAPTHFRLEDMADAVLAVVEHLGLRPFDVVGHSMGGFVGGFVASRLATVRLVSIDGFGPGVVPHADERGRAEFAAFQAAMKASLLAMTAPPERGDRRWRDAEVERLVRTLPTAGYAAPNVAAMVERNFVEVDADVWERRPLRRLFEDLFANGGDRDVLRMYREVRGPTLLVRCTRSGAPGALDDELATLVAANPNVEVARLEATHMGPAWDAVDDVARLVDDFFARAPAP